MLNHGLNKTPHIAYIKHEKTAKEIADSLNLDERTVCFHRENIRKRLGINKTETNLRSFLSTLE